MEAVTMAVPHPHDIAYPEHGHLRAMAHCRCCPKRRAAAPQVSYQCLPAVLHRKMMQRLR